MSRARAWAARGTAQGLALSEREKRASWREGVYLRYAGKRCYRTSENLAALLPGARTVAASSYPLSMARTRTVFPRDRGLQSRMLITLFLLGVLYVAFAGVLFAAGAGIGIMVVVLAGLS